MSMPKLLPFALKRHGPAWPIAVVVGAILYFRVQPHPRRQFTTDQVSDIADVAVSPAGDRVAFHLRPGGVYLYDYASADMSWVATSDQFALTAAGELIHVDMTLQPGWPRPKASV